MKSNAKQYKLMQINAKQGWRGCGCGVTLEPLRLGYAVFSKCKHAHGAHRNRIRKTSVIQNKYAQAYWTQKAAQQKVDAKLYMLTQYTNKRWTQNNTFKHSTQNECR